MKTRLKANKTDDLRPEYDFASLLKKGVRGKYAKRFAQGTNLVLLAPDVAPAFPDEAAVNDALRLVIRIRRLPVPRTRKQVVAKA